LSFWVFFGFFYCVHEGFPFRLSYGFFQFFLVLCVSLYVLCCRIPYSFRVKFMLFSDLFFVFWCAPCFFSCFGSFFVSFDCLLYRCLDVVQVLICRRILVGSLLYCYDCCSYLIEDGVFIFVISVF
jgi:hypothetical protein